jgi:PAS domain S-box-containing protein
MLNIALLLFGVYSFMHIRIPSYWARFALYLLVWAIIGYFYDFDVLSTYLPIFLYQIIATITRCYIIFRYWDVPLLEKLLAMIIFFIWGIGKSGMSIYEAYFFHYYAISPLYQLEIVFSNILNFCIFVVYLHRSKDSVQFAERFYRILAEKANDIIFYYELKPNPTFRYITPSVEKVTGYTPEEFYRNSKFYLELAVPEEMDALSKMFSGNEESERQKVFRVQHKDSSLMWLEINESILYENGDPVAVYGIMRDITKMKEDEDELLRSTQSRDRLLSYVSHEIQTPVTAILGYINGIKDGTFESKREVDTALDVIFSKSLTLQKLIQDLVQLSKLEAKQFSFEMTQISVLELCQNLVNIHVLDIQSAGLKLNTSIDVALLAKAEIIIDTKRIEQVVSNIIFNALKYSPKGSTVTITCSLDKSLKNLVLQISDDGPGILAEDLPYIFERFFRGRIPAVLDDQSGSGLGLTLSKEIISAFNGEIFAQNAKGGGSIFTILLPVYRDSQSYQEN